MKTLFKLLVPILLVSVSLSTANATGTKGEHGKRKWHKTGERIYVLNNVNREMLSTDGNLEIDCGFAYPWTVLSGVKSDLYSIQTQSAHARVVNDSVKKVGKLIACVLETTDGPLLSSPLYEGKGESRYAVNPTQNINIAYSILLNGKQYYATGSGRFRTDPISGVPYPGFYLMGATATVINPMFEVVGSYTANAALAWPESEEAADNLDKEGGIIVLRISEPKRH